MINKNTKMFLFMVTLLVLIVGLTAVTATDSNNQTNTATTPSVTPTTDTTVSTTSSLTTNTQNDVKDTTTTKETTKTNTNNVKTNTPTTTTTKKATTTTVSDYQGLYNAVETAKGSTDDSYTINLNPGNYNITNPITWGSSTGTLRNLTINGNQQTIDGQNTKHFITIQLGYTLNLNNITIQNTNNTQGGAITNNGNTSITNSLLKNNTANFGGAIYNTGTQTITNNTIQNNNAKLDGGAIYNEWGNQNITNNIIQNNTADYGGTISNFGGNQNITNNIIQNNTAKINGGAISNFAGNQNITDNIIQNNNATESGGAIDNTGGNQNITNNTIQNNTANYGGAICNSGTQTITNNTIQNNTASQGGAIYNTNGNQTITNNSVISNSVSGIDRFVIENDDGNMTVSDNLFVNNTDGRDILLNSTVPISVFDNVYIDNMLNDSMVNISDVNVSDVNSSYDFNATVNLRDVYNDTIDNGTVNVYINGVLYKGFNVTNGVAQITLPANKLTFKNNITLQYNTLSKHYQNASTSFILNLEKLNTTTTVNPIIGVVGDVYEIQANVTDQNNKPVNGGTVIFKINNVTLKDESGNPIKVYVNNGTAKYNITLPTYFSKENMTITAIYSGTPHTYYQSISTPAKINVTKRNATITVMTSQINNAEDKITLTAIVTDKLTNKTLNTGVVVFKYQGHTITDENGNPILVNVTNGIAKLEYTIPTGTSSHNYTITAVYSNRDYNRAENTTNQFINKTPTKITFNATENTPGSTPRTITLKGNITDLKNTQVIGTNKVCVKINGKTLTDNKNQTIYYNITNGNIDLNITTNYTGTIKNITITTGERNGYNASTKTTTTNLTKTTKTTKTTIPAKI